MMRRDDAGPSINQVSWYALLCFFSARVVTVAAAERSPLLRHETSPLMEENQSLLEEKGRKAPPAGGEFPGLAAHTKD